VLFVVLLLTLLLFFPILIISVIDMWNTRLEIILDEF